MSDPIDEIDRLHEEATPGPWSLFGVVCHIEVVCGWPNGDVVPILRMHKDGDWPSNGAPPAHIAIANGQFVAALRNAWPAIRERLKAAERKSAPRTRHDGDCSIYRSLSNGCPHDGICTCGYSHERLFECDSSQMFSEERLKAMRGEEVDQ